MLVYQPSLDSTPKRKSGQKACQAVFPAGTAFTYRLKPLLCALAFTQCILKLLLFLFCWQNKWFYVEMRAEKWINVRHEENVSEIPVKTGRSFYVCALHCNSPHSSLLWYFLTLPFAMIMREPCAVYKKSMYNPDTVYHGLKWNNISQNRPKWLHTVMLLEGRATTSNVPSLSTDINFLTLIWQ